MGQPRAGRLSRGPTVGWEPRSLSVNTFHPGSPSEAAAPHSHGGNHREPQRNLHHSNAGYCLESRRVLRIVRDFLPIVSTLVFQTDYNLNLLNIRFLFLSRSLMVQKCCCKAHSDWRWSWLAVREMQDWCSRRLMMTQNTSGDSSGLELELELEMMDQNTQ